MVPASDQIVSLIAGGFEAYARGDDETLRELFDPEIEVYAEPGVLNAGTFVGWEGWNAWTAQWEEAWDRITYEPREIIPFDDERVLVPVHVVGIGKGSGVEVSDDNCYLFEIRDVKLARFHLYRTKENALAAAERLAARG